MRSSGKVVYSSLTSVYVESSDKMFGMEVGRVVGKSLGTEDLSVFGEIT